nr:hypothetical protein [Sulfolobus sp. E11-6]
MERNSRNRDNAENNTDKEIWYKIGKARICTLIKLNVSVEKTA